MHVDVEVNDDVDVNVKLKLVLMLMLDALHRAHGGEVWEIEKQAAMCKEIAAAIGFDFDK